MQPARISGAFAHWFPASGRIPGLVSASAWRR
jgi:hypothetical protein